MPKRANASQGNPNTPGSLQTKERAYIAASRRSDRSLEARVQSAHAASETHHKRTGKWLRVTEKIVSMEEMYEEEDDIILRSRHRKLSGEGASFYDSTSSLDTLSRQVDQQFNEMYPNWTAKVSAHHASASVPAPAPTPPSSGFAPYLGLTTAFHAGTVPAAPVDPTASAVDQPPWQAVDFQDLSSARGGRQDSLTASPTAISHMGFGDPTRMSTPPAVGGGYGSPDTDTTVSSRHTSILSRNVSQGSSLSLSPHLSPYDCPLPHVDQGFVSTAGQQQSPLTSCVPADAGAVSCGPAIDLIDAIGNPVLYKPPMDPLILGFPQAFYAGIGDITDGAVPMKCDDDFSWNDFIIEDPNHTAGIIGTEADLNDDDGGKNLDWICDSLLDSNLFRFGELALRDPVRAKRFEEYRGKMRTWLVAKYQELLQGREESLPVAHGAMQEERVGPRRAGDAGTGVQPDAPAVLRDTEMTREQSSHPWRTLVVKTVQHKMQQHLKELQQKPGDGDGDLLKHLDGATRRNLLLEPLAQLASMDKVSANTPMSSDADMEALIQLWIQSPISSLGLEAA